MNVIRPANSLAEHFQSLELAVHAILDQTKTLGKMDANDKRETSRTS